LLPAEWPPDRDKKNAKHLPYCLCHQKNPKLVQFATFVATWAFATDLSPLLSLSLSLVAASFLLNQLSFLSRRKQKEVRKQNIWLK